MEKFKKLSETELIVMKKIWEEPKGIESESIYLYFQNRCARGTTATILHRISQKGYLKQIKKGRHTILIPTMTASDYNKTIIEHELEKTFGSKSIENLIATFCGKKKLTKNQVDTLRDFLKEIEDD